MLLFVGTAAAHASSTLLSGYGGPGQGNQAIIGASLIGGGKSSGGGGSGGGEGGGGGAGASASASSLPAAIALPQPAPARKSPSTGRGGSHGGPRTGSSHRTEQPQGEYAPTALSAQRSIGGATLGLSGGDLAYIILAFGALALTALLTARLARRGGEAGRAQ